MAAYWSSVPDPFCYTFHLASRMGCRWETDEVEGNTLMFPSFDHSNLELETDVEGKMIRVCWRAEKEWYIGKVGVFDAEAKTHKIE